MADGREQLRSWMKRRGVNQREAAKLLGIHWTILNQHLSGRRRPSLTKAIAIERLTGIPVEAWLAPAVDHSADPAPAKHSKAHVGRL